MRLNTGSLQWSVAGGLRALAPGMSRKQVAKARQGRKTEAERKRDERAARRALAKERRNRPDADGDGDAEEFLSFANQLQALGLRLREVPGDGNCLFRALGDQLEGHSRNHLKHRQETVDYMVRQRIDFEPFVEDDVPFDRHIASLSKPGTFAGNDAIVSFARNNEVNIVIHQLNKPLWQICGTDKTNARELHIAYRYGEHYDSVRRFNDNSETPACLRTEMLSKDGSIKVKNKPAKESHERQEMDDFQEDVEEAVQKVHNATGCSNIELILQNLEAENYNIETAVFAILQMDELNRIDVEEEATEPKVRGQHSSESWMENGNETSVFQNQEHSLSGTQDDTTQNNPKEENKANKNTPQKLSNKQRKVEQRQEKKRRQEERQRQKVLETRSNTDNNQQRQEEPDPQVTLVKTFAAVTI